MMGWLDFFKEDKHIDSNDPYKLLKTIRYLKRFFSNKDFIKDKKLHITIVVVNKNIIKYIELENKVMLNNNIDPIKQLLKYEYYKQINLQEFISIDKNIMLDHIGYINNHLDNIEVLIEFYLNTEKQVTSKILYKYIIHVVSIYRDIYATYN